MATCVASTESRLGDEHRIVVAEGGRLDRVLSDGIGNLSRSRLARLVKDGGVTVDGEVVTKPSTAVDVGSQLVVTVPKARRAEAIPQDLPLTIVYQDADLAVIDKEPGVVVHPAPGHPDGTLVNALLHHLDDLSGIGGVQRPGIVHRLDKGTSGLLVVAKNDAAHAALAAQFADRTAGREYLALCLGQPEGNQGTISNRLARHPTHRMRYTAVETGGKVATTHWSVMVRGEASTLFRCTLETGRTHQVRVHLCEAGFPLVGDPLYKRGRHVPRGLRGHIPDDRPALHATELHLVHPSSGERVSFHSPLPDDLRDLCRRVGIDPNRIE